MKRAVVLMNLGSPDSTSIKDLKKYLDEFLMDERVIDKPWLLRALLVKGIIVPFRAANSSKAYQTVWTKDGSPLINITKEVQVALQKKIEEPVFIAMRYGNPSPKNMFQQLVKENPDLEDVLMVPMYPHYAMSSYETAVEYARDEFKKLKYSFNIHFIKPFFNDEDYIHALSENIKPYVEKEYDQIIFSYHGIPERHILKSDITHKHCLQSANCCDVASPAHKYCYRHQGWTTTNLVAKQLNIPKNKWAFSFQSRLGNDPWLQPYTAVRLQQLPAEGIKKVIVVCPAFVSDCLETLQEMGIEGREIFMKAGGESFDLVPCLNTNELWINLLAKWVHQFANNNTEMLLENYSEEDAR